MGSTTEQKKTTHTGNATLIVIVILPRCSQNLGPPKIYGKSLIKDLIDQKTESSGSAKKTILLEHNFASVTETIAER